MLVTRGDDWLTSGENSWLRCTNEIIAECHKTSPNSTVQSSPFYSIFPNGVDRKTALDAAIPSKNGRT